MHEAPAPPRQWNAALPARYDDVFARALAKDPALRFPTAAAFVAALDIRELEYMLSEPAAASPIAAAPPGDDSPTILTVPPTAPAQPTAGRGARGLVLAALGLIALFAASWLVLRRAPGEPAEAAAPPATIESPAALPPAPTLEAATPAPSARPRVAAAPKPAPEAAPTPEPTATPAPTPVIEGDLVELGPGVTPPVRIKGDSATYPESARRMKLRGSVLVALIVDENGLPTDLQVVESAGPILDEVVLKAMRTWRFEPARKDGVRVKVRWQARQTYKTAP